MAERQQDLGHVCPACEREFKEIQDYPKVFVASVSVVTPDDVPAELPAWDREDLLEVPYAGWNREFVPYEVLEYFQANPDQDSLVHSDSYIYHRPYNQTHPEMYDRPGVVSAGGYCYERQFNQAPAVRALLEQNAPLREYLGSLQQMAGQEVSTKEVYPKWQQHYFPSVFHVPSGLAIPNADRFLLRLSESEDRPTEYRVAEVRIYSNGPSMGSVGGPTIQRVMSIGALKIGRAHV